MKTLTRAILSFLLLSGCAVTNSAGRTNNASPQDIAAHSERVRALVAEMTLEEKLGQLTQSAGGRSKSLNSRLTPEELERVRRGEVGSYLHVAGAEALGELQRVAVEESRLGVPLLFALDLVHGYRTIFPVPLAMASAWDPSVWEQTARLSAIEASAAGLHWTFAPMVDIARDPRWGRIVEGAGIDPYLGARMAAAQVSGYQGGDLASPDTVLATAKHFGAYGAAIGGRDYGSADISTRSLHEIYLPPFYAAHAAGAGSMMTAFNDIAGVPSTANEHLIDGVLRGVWGFDGMIVSDWNAVAELINHGVAETRLDAGQLALQAGVDMDMTSGVFGADLHHAIAGDDDLLADVDLAVSRVLTAKEKLGLFDSPMAYHDTSREAESMLTVETRNASRAVAAQTLVLLKNGNAALPIEKNDGSIVVIGGLAEDKLTQLGSWRARGDAGDVVSILDGLRREAPAGVTISYSLGADPRNEDQSGIGAAVRAAKKADRVILVVGEHYDLSGEARSRSDITMPANQIALARAIFETKKPVTVLLITGRPLAIPMLAEQADAILVTWMLGVEAGPAIADVVFGRTSPAGRLPADFPRVTGQAPFTYSEAPGGRPADSDVSKDTNRYMDIPITPLFPFGHGLSYSKFDYGELTPSRRSIEPNENVALSLSIENTGDRVADEVVQLYARDPVASIARPKLELRGFKRVTLRPGERKIVTFTVDAAQMAIFQAPGDWRIEPGAVEFHVGASSSDIRSSAKIRIERAGKSSVPATAIETQVSVQ